MNATPRIDTLAKVPVEKLLDQRSSKYHVCGMSLRWNTALGHYKVLHLDRLRGIAKQIDKEADARSTSSQTRNQDSGFSIVVSTSQPPQVSRPPKDCGTSGFGPQQRPDTASAHVAPSIPSIKQEMLAQGGDDDIVVVFDRAAAPYFVRPYGEGFRVYVRDTKDLRKEHASVLLSILVPPDHAPAAAARSARLKFDFLDTGGTRIDVADTGLLTVAQWAALRRVIGGITDDVVGGQPQKRVNLPVPVRLTLNSTDMSTDVIRGFEATSSRPCLKVPSAANAKAKRGRPPKNPSEPKRARTDYMFFVQAHRARLAGSVVAPRDAIRAAAREWQQLSEEGRRPYRQMANDDKARYEAERAQHANGL